jgi:putative exosortase-associated protein (TIGR04073 family)
MLSKIITIIAVIGIITTISASESTAPVKTNSEAAVTNPATVPQPTTGNAYQADPGNPVKKLARGIVNALIGVGEIPIEIAKTEEAEGLLPAVSYGTLKGICFFILRELIGVADVATFYMPLPGTVNGGKRCWGYGPLMEPEWVIE